MILEARDLSVRFRRGVFFRVIDALDGFSITVNPGDVYGLLGPNGAGKSTALYCALGLIRARRGEVRILGETPRPGSRLFERVAYVPEEPHYHLYLSVEDAVRYYGSLYRTPVPRSKALEAIERVGLMEFRDLRLEKCSKGMKQKVGIACCLLKRPDIILLDEPTRGLDPATVREVRDILSEMNRQGTTIFLNSHVLSEVELICNRVAIVKKGRVVVEDALTNLLRIEKERYAVTIEKSREPAADEPPLPAMFQKNDETPDTVKGLVPSEDVAEFFSAARALGLVVRECSLRRLTLEDAFMEWTKES